MKLVRPGKQRKGALAKKDGRKNQGVGNPKQQKRKNRRAIPGKQGRGCAGIDGSSGAGANCAGGTGGRTSRTLTAA